MIAGLVPIAPTVNHRKCRRFIATYRLLWMSAKVARLRVLLRAPQAATGTGPRGQRSSVLTMTRLTTPAAAAIAYGAS